MLVEKFLTKQSSSASSRMTVTLLVSSNWASPRPMLTLFLWATDLVMGWTGGKPLAAPPPEEARILPDPMPSSVRQFVAEFDMHVYAHSFQLWKLVYQESEKH